MPVSMTLLVAMLVATALAAGLSATAARWASRRPHLGSVGPWWGAIAVGLADVIGHVGVATPSIPPGDVTDRIPLLALAGSVVAASLGGGRDRFWSRMVGDLVLVGLTLVVILGPVLGRGDLPAETIIGLAITAGVALLAAINVAWFDGPARRSDLWVGMTVLSLGAGLVLVLANSAVLFQLGGVLAVMLAASLLGSWGRPIGGGIPVAIAVLTALIVEGFVYAFLPGPVAVLLAGSPAMLWLTRLGPIARLGPKARAAVSAILVLIPVAVAIGFVLASKSSDDSGY